MKLFLLLLMAVVMTPPASAKDKATTLQGVAQATKDGFYVDGVMISDSALPRGQSMSQFLGKKVQVKGVVQEVHEEDPNLGKDPAKDPMVQARVGSWKMMRKVESITILP